MRFALYEGRLLHQLPAVRTPRGDIYVELYLCEPAETNRVALYRRGTRVIDDLTLLDHLSRAPWNARSLQGHLDAPFLDLTPGTRAGIIQDFGLRHVLRGIRAARAKTDRAPRSTAPRGRGTGKPGAASHHPARLPGSPACLARRGIRLVRYRGAETPVHFPLW